MRQLTEWLNRPEYQLLETALHAKAYQLTHEAGEALADSMGTPDLSKNAEQFAIDAHFYKRMGDTLEILRKESDERELTIISKQPVL